MDLDDAFGKQKCHCYERTCPSGSASPRTLPRSGSSVRLPKNAAHFPVGRGGRQPLQPLLSFIVVRQHMIIASPNGAHPRVASLAPVGQFTFWQSPGTASKIRTLYQAIETWPFSTSPPRKRACPVSPGHALFGKYFPNSDLFLYSPFFNTPAASSRSGTGRARAGRRPAARRCR